MCASTVHVSHTYLCLSPQPMVVAPACVLSCDWPQVEEDRYKALLNRSNSENIATNYFRSTRASQLLGRETTKALGKYRTTPA